MVDSIAKERTKISTAFSARDFSNSNPLGYCGQMSDYQLGVIQNEAHYILVTKQSHFPS